jgi:hypothetical protein
MNRRQGLCLLLGLLPLSAGVAAGQDDPGKEAIGKVNVRVFYGTNGDPSVAGSRFKTVEREVEKQLREAPNLTFSNFLLLGGDQQPLFRSYENWAQPLRPSDEILVRFEARSRPTADSARLDLEIWISRKKILKTDALLGGETPLFILGPEWRGGRLIIAVSLAS